MWSVSKALQIPLDKKIKELHEIPYTISFVVKKRQQLDSIYELEESKRPPESLIWNGSSEEISDYIQNALARRTSGMDILISDNEIEG